MGNIIPNQAAAAGDNDNVQNQDEQQGAGAGGVFNWNLNFGEIRDGAWNWIENWWQIVLGVVVSIIVISGLYFFFNYFAGEEEEVKLNFTESKPDRKDLFFGTANAATLAYSLYRLAKMLF